MLLKVHGEHCKKKNIQKQLHQWNNKKVIALGTRQHKNKFVLCFYCGKVVQYKKPIHIWYPCNRSNP